MARRFAGIIIPVLLVIQCLLTSTMIPEASQAFAQSEQAGSIQLDMLCRYLGIQPEKGVDFDQAPRFFAAIVLDPQTLFSLGLYGTKAGDRINLVNLGPDHWRIKHYATGHAIEFRYHPPPSN